MRLLTINGSPKPSKSNTGVMIDAFLEPVKSFDDIVKLNMVSGNITNMIDMIRMSDHIILLCLYMGMQCLLKFYNS